MVHVDPYMHPVVVGQFYFERLASTYIFFGLFVLYSIFLQRPSDRMRSPKTSAGGREKYITDKSTASANTHLWVVVVGSNVEFAHPNDPS